MKINTVLGQIDSSALGFTLMHEHIINVDWSFVKAFGNEFYDKNEVVRLFKEDMETLKPLGVKTLVDMTPINLGRDLEIMQRCSEAAEINIIAVTGLYSQEFPFYHSDVSIDRCLELFLRDLEKGMEGSTCKAGLVKCATNRVPGTTTNNENMIRAAVRAAQIAVVPLCTHVESGSDLGLWQQQIIESEGMDFNHVYYSHVFTRPDEAYLQTLEKGGAYLGCDQLAFSMKAPVDMLLRYMKDDRKRRQVFISTDSAIRTDFGFTLSDRLRDRKTNSLCKEFIRKQRLIDELPLRFEEAGITKEQTREVFVDNPRRYFEIG